MHRLKRFICGYLTKAKQQKDLMEMDGRMLADLGISRVDAERFAGRFAVLYKGKWRLKNERNKLG